MIAGSTAAPSRTPRANGCCGDYDCKSYTRASSTTTGWMIDGEFVPFDEAMPVAPPDGQVTISCLSRLFLVSRFWESPLCDSPDFVSGQIRVGWRAARDRKNCNPNRQGNPN